MPVVVPPAVLVALVAVPLLSGLVGAVLAAARRPVDPITRAERLAW